MDNELIPTGEFRNVNKTPFDFRNQKLLDNKSVIKTHSLKSGWAMTAVGCWTIKTKGCVLLRLHMNQRVEECSKFFLMNLVFSWILVIFLMAHCQINQMARTYIGQVFVLKHNITPTYLIRKIFLQLDLTHVKNTIQKQFLDYRLYPNNGSCWSVIVLDQCIIWCWDFFY